MGLLQPVSQSCSASGIAISGTGTHNCLAKPSNPTLLPISYQDKYELYGRERVVCDYIAGMTDRYALDEYKRLYEPY